MDGADNTSLFMVEDRCEGISVCIKVEKVALEQVVFPNTSVFFCQLPFHQCSIFISASPEDGTVGPLVVAEPRVSASPHAQE
jgi:hypothetical protein